ncbi:low molecular weight phosphotyrosine protein phosphatase-like isoform X3 [Tachypleus tridentatus]
MSFTNCRSCICSYSKTTRGSRSAYFLNSDYYFQWIIDSAATGDWHVGCQPDKRARNCMKKYGIEMNHKARLVHEDDFNNFDYVFGMDENNINDLKEIAPRSYRAELELLGKYDPEGELIIQDPYYDRGDKGFERVYEQCIRCCNNFLDQNL